MLLKDYLNMWLNKYVKHTVKLRTFIRYQEICDKHINPILGKLHLEELSSSILQDFIVLKLEKGNLITNQGLSVNSCLSIINVLKQALNLALSLELVEKINISNIKLPKLTEKKIEVFEKHEQQKIEKYCLNSKKSNHIGIIICLYTGIRLGELLALTWKDIDFENKLLFINKTMSYLKVNGKRQIVVDEPKTKTSNRVIPLSNQLLKLLKNIKKKSVYVITTKNNTMVMERCYQKTFKDILNKCHIPYKNFHSLRHTFATRAIENGMDVKTLSEILGHKNPSITLSRYSHSLLSHKREALNKLSKMLDL